MDEKSNLKLLPKPRDGWHQCTKWSCQDPETDWWIKSPSHGQCFWRYLKDKSDVNGVMKELVQSELAALFGWSNTKTHFMLKQAIEELTSALKLYGAVELLQDLDADELENLIVPEDLVDLPPDDRE